jgi:hypothetical protein
MDVGYWDGSGFLMIPHQAISLSRNILGSVPMNMGHCIGHSLRIPSVSGRRRAEAGGQKLKHAPPAAWPTKPEKSAHEQDKNNRGAECQELGIGSVDRHGGFSNNVENRRTGERYWLRLRRFRESRWHAKWDLEENTSTRTCFIALVIPWS